MWKGSVVKRLLQLLARGRCWWFGCDPSGEHHYDYGHEEYRQHCGRCGCLDVDYADLIGDTRHRRFVRWITAPVRWLRPTPKCKDCGLSEDRAADLSYVRRAYVLEGPFYDLDKAIARRDDLAKKRP